MDAFSCPNCALRLMVPVDLAGTHVPCPECGASVSVPSPVQAFDFAPRTESVSSFPSIATPVDICDILPRDPADDGRLQPWRVGRWIGTGGALVFGGAALLLLCAVQGYRQIAAAANEVVKPAAVGFPRPAFKIPPPPVRARPVGMPRPVAAADAPHPPEPPPAPIVIGGPGN
jgi:hypothetical protein